MIAAIMLYVGIVMVWLVSIIVGGLGVVCIIAAALALWGPFVLKHSPGVRAVQ